MLYPTKRRRLISLILLSIVIGPKGYSGSLEDCLAKSNKAKDAALELLTNKNTEDRAGKLTMVGNTQLVFAKADIQVADCYRREARKDPKKASEYNKKAATIEEKAIEMSTDATQNLVNGQNLKKTAVNATGEQVKASQRRPDAIENLDGSTSVTAGQGDLRAVDQGIGAFNGISDRPKSSNGASPDLNGDGIPDVTVRDYQDANGDRKSFQGYTPDGKNAIFGSGNEAVQVPVKEFSGKRFLDLKAVPERTPTSPSNSSSSVQATTSLPSDVVDLNNLPSRPEPPSFGQLLRKQLESAYSSLPAGSPLADNWIERDKDIYYEFLRRQYGAKEIGYPQAMLLELEDQSKQKPRFKRNGAQ